jgi:hypothetical protein
MNNADNADSDEIVRGEWGSIRSIAAGRKRWRLRAGHQATLHHRLLAIGYSPSPLRYRCATRCSGLVLNNKLRDESGSAQEAKFRVRSRGPTGKVGRPGLPNPLSRGRDRSEYGSDRRPSLVRAGGIG